MAGLIKHHLKAGGGGWAGGAWGDGGGAWGGNQEMATIPISMLQELLNSSAGAAGKVPPSGGGKSVGVGGKGGGGKGVGKKGKSGGKKGGGDGDPPGSGRVFVRGFDFGTTDEQFYAHMGTAGEIHQVHWVTKGSAEVVYNTRAEAEAATLLDKSIMIGNTRFVDVILKESEGPGFGAVANDPPGSGRVFVRGFDFGTTEDQLRAHMGIMGRIINLRWAGRGEAEIIYQTKHEAQAALGLTKSTIAGNTRFIDVILKESEGVGFGGEGNDPVGSGRIFVRGFDFGTTEQQLVAHLGTVGNVIKLHWAGRGEVECVYKNQMSAIAAASQLHQSTIPGNMRFIDVILKESE